MRKLSGALLLLLARCATPLPAQVAPTLIGFVTEPGTPFRFQVDGYTILCTNGKTTTNHREGAGLRGTTLCAQHFLGEQLSVYGERAHFTVDATELLAVPPTDTPAEGTALTDLVVSKNSKAAVVRADGYLLQFSPDTKITYESTLQPSLESFQTNQWIAYRGIAHPDGTVLVQKARLGPNVISDAEDQLRTKADFDAAAVDDTDRQGGVSKFFTGIDRTRIPAYEDPALQRRVNAIGTQLIPAYQRALPEGDPSKISFRFQLVEDSKYAFYPLASGIILLSHTAVQKLTEDSQLAAVLATAIAQVLQKQELRWQPAKHAMTASLLAGDVAGALVPGVALVPLLANHEARRRIEERDLQQNARETLCLLHDAGFDLHQAPLAFWAGNQKQGKTSAESPITTYPRYLYLLLGTAWRSEDEPLPQSKQATLPRPQAGGD